MKRSLLSCVCLVLFIAAADANTYSFVPSSSNLNDLNHNEFFTWGLNWTIPQGETIVGAQLSFAQIWDWRVESDALFIHLLDTAPVGVNAWLDNQGGGDFFASSLFNSLGIAHIKLAQWSDPAGGNPKKAQNVTFNFTSSQLATLAGYLSSPGQNGWARFGFGFDPDCHYFNKGVSFTITTQRPGVPETGSTAALLALGFGAVSFARKRFPRA